MCSPPLSAYIIHFSISSIPVKQSKVYHSSWTENGTTVILVSIWFFTHEENIEQNLKLVTAQHQPQLLVLSHKINVFLGAGH